jgi:EmrB/QacA subfamily drug resistance transporter
MAERRRIAVVAILLSTFLSAAESTIIATAMPSVVADLGGLELYGWVGAIYMLAATVTIPIHGKLADLWGRKPVIVVGIITFLIGSMASGVAPSMGFLIAARAVQGIGAGGTQPIAMTIIGDMYSPKERARMQGLFGAVWGVSGIAGPLLGGLIVHSLSWRWVFYFNLPFGLIAIALLLYSLGPSPDKPKGPRSIDVAGAALLSTAVLALLSGIGGHATSILLPTSAVAVGLFILVERKHPEPLLPMDLMRKRLIAVSSAAGAVVGGVMTASVTYLPLLMQAVMLASPTAAGATVAPMLVGWPIASALSGRWLLRVGTRPLVRTGFSLVAVASIVLDVLVMRGSGENPLRACMFVFGVGMGLANTALIITVQDSVPFSRRGVATASTMFFRMIGGAIAVGVLGVVLARGLAGRVPEEILDQLLGPEHGRNIAAAELAGYRADVQQGMVPIFHVLAGMGVLGAMLGFLFPDVIVGASAPAQAESKTTTSGA